jgi:hypothetical protein
MNAPQIQTQNKPQIPTAGIWKRYFEHPKFGIIAGIFSIVGFLSLPLDVYLYYHTIKEPELKYFIYPNRAPIVQKGIFNEFTVSYLGLPVNGDLTLVQMQFWNQGKQAVREEDILKTITIRPSGNQPIYKVVIVPSREILGARCNIVTNQGEITVELKWKILECNDYIKLQIIYGGSVDIPFVVDGICVGQKQITAFKMPTQTALVSHNYKMEFASIFISLLVIIIMVHDVYKNFKKARLSRWPKYIYLLLGTGGVILIGYTMYQIVQVIHVLSSPLVL